MHHQDQPTNGRLAAGRAPLRMVPSGPWPGQRPVSHGRPASPLRSLELGIEPDVTGDDCDMESVMVRNDVREAARGCCR